MALWAAETFTVSDGCAGDGYQAWGDICRESLISDFAKKPAAAGGWSGAQLTRRWLDDLLHLHFSSPAFTGGVSPGSDIGDYIGIGLADSPSYREEVRFRTGLSTVRRNKLVVWDMSLLDTFTGPPQENTAATQTQVLFPRRGLKDLTDRLRSQGGLWEPDSNTGQMLAAMIVMLNDADQTLEPEAGVAIRNALIEILSGTILSGIQVAHSVVSEVMRRKIESWVRANLQDGDVSPAAAASAHGLSLRSVHRMFDECDGTYGAFVRSARFERARQDVIASGEPVQRIAMRWGYADASSFCREFRRTTGMTTSEYRATTQGNLDPARVESVLR